MKAQALVIFAVVSAALAISAGPLFVPPWLQGLIRCSRYQIVHENLNITEATEFCESSKAELPSLDDDGDFLPCLRRILPRRLEVWVLPDTDSDKHGMCKFASPGPHGVDIRSEPCSKKHYFVCKKH